MLWMRSSVLGSRPRASVVVLVLMRSLTGSPPLVFWFGPAVCDISVVRFPRSSSNVSVVFFTWSQAYLSLGSAGLAPSVTREWRVFSVPSGFHVSLPFVLVLAAPFQLLQLRFSTPSAVRVDSPVRAPFLAVVSDHFSLKLPSRRLTLVLRSKLRSF